MACTPERVWRAIHDAGSEGGERACPGTIAYGGASDRDDRRRRVMIPAQFDYVRAGSVDEAVAALAEHGDDAKVLAGGQSLIPLLRHAAGLPRGRGRRRAGRGDARCPRGRRPPRHRRDDDPPRGHPRRRWCSQHCGLVAQATETVADPADPAPRHLRRLARPRRPRRRPARGGAGAGRRVRRRGQRWPAHGAGGGLLRRLSADGARARRGARRGAGAQARRRLGLPLREVPPGRPGVGDRRRRRRGAPVQRVDRRGAHRADQHGRDTAAGQRGRAGAGRCRPVGHRRGGRDMPRTAPTRPAT